MAKDFCSQGGRELRSQFSVPEFRGKECSMMRHLSMVVRLGPRPPAWRPCWRRSPGRVERSPRWGSGYPAHSQDDSLSSSLAHPLSTNAPTLSAHFVIYRSPSAGRGLGEADVTVHQSGQGFHGVRPFWPCREARPLHTCSDSPKRYYTKILPREASRRLGE